MVTLNIFRIGVAEKALDGEFAAFDPHLGCIADGIENDGTAICRRDDNARVIWCGAGASVWFEFAVEEFIEIFKLVDRFEDFVHVEFVEIYEAFDFAGGGRVVVFAALFKGEGT